MEPYEITLKHKNDEERLELVAVLEENEELAVKSAKQEFDEPMDLQCVSVIEKGPIMKNTIFLNGQSKEKSAFVGFEERFFETLEMEEPLRTNQLSNLLDDMQHHYKIPAIANKEFNKKHARVMKLFRAVSKSRNL